MSRARRAKQRIDYSGLSLDEEGEESDDALIPSPSSSSPSEEVEVLAEHPNLEAESEVEGSPDLVQDSISAGQDHIFFKDEELEESSKPHVKPHRTYETMRERMGLFYGFGDLELLRAIKLRRAWGDAMFMVPEPLIFRTEVPITAASTYISTLEPKDLCSPIPGSNINLEGLELGPGDTRRASGVRILNAGGLVTTTSWSADGIHLAIGVVPGDSIELPAVRSDLSANSVQRGSGYLQIWRLTEEDMQLESVIDIGIPRQIAWRTSCKKEMAVVLQDGTLVLCDPVCSGILHPRRFRLDQKATTVCWSDTEHLVVGTRQGCIAEFVIDSEYPSFVWPVHYSLINSVASASPQHSSIVLTTSVDGFCKVINLEDIRRSQATAPRHKLFSPFGVWCPFVESFVTAEDTSTTRLLPVRNPGIIRTGTSLTHHEGMVTCVGASKSHPIIISGGSDGSVHVSNALRRATTTRRTSKVHFEACLWILECNERHGQYRFVEKLAPSMSGKQSRATDRIPLYPKTVAITTLEFSPNSAWFAAGSASGLVRVESLDPRPG